MATEPAVTGANAAIAACTAAVTTGAITVTGSILGLEYQLLLIGMFGGLIAVSFMEKTSRTRMAVSVATSALLAGYAAPVIAAVSVSQIPALAGVATEPLRLFCALLVGVCAQTLIPVTLGWLRKVGGQS